MRCFIALDLPAPVRNYLAGRAHKVAGKGSVKWVPADQLHMTLLFAGDVDATASAALCQAVQQAELPPLQLQLASLAQFPPRGEPRVLYAGIGGDLQALQELQAGLAEQAAAVGIPRERRPFVPHITLGRLKSPFGALTLLHEWQRIGSELRDKPFQPTALALYRSELRPGGPVHSLLAAQPLV